MQHIWFLTLVKIYPSYKSGLYLTQSVSPNILSIEQVTLDIESILYVTQGQVNLRQELTVVDFCQKRAMQTKISHRLLVMYINNHFLTLAGTPSIFGVGPQNHIRLGHSS